MSLIIESLSEKISSVLLINYIIEDASPTNMRVGIISILANRVASLTSASSTLTRPSILFRADHEKYQ